jgi:osmoprotectant transport system substrate-binding protein
VHHQHDLAGTEAPGVRGLAVVDVRDVLQLGATEPAIAGNGLVVLADPKHLFSAQNVTPLIYRSALSATGRAALDAVSTRLTTDALMRMNVRILVDKVAPRTVAGDWLRQAGLRADAFSAAR